MKVVKSYDAQNVWRHRFRESAQISKHLNTRRYLSVSRFPDYNLHIYYAYYTCIRYNSYSICISKQSDIVLSIKYHFHVFTFTVKRYKVLLIHGILPWSFSKTWLDHKKSGILFRKYFTCYPREHPINIGCFRFVCRQV